MANVSCGGESTSDARFPYSRLILTDLEQQGVPDPNNDAAVLLHQQTSHNVKVLTDCGVSGPRDKISGFASQTYTSFDKIGVPIGMAFWGSPHWASKDQDSVTSHMESSQEFKTNAFESMGWLAGSAMILMCFNENYKVEFWHPLFNKKHGTEPDTRDPRQLTVLEGYFRQYQPIVSGSEHHLIGGGKHPRVLVAMLVPERFRDLLTYKGPKLDVGKTMYRILQTLQQGQEYAIELGGQSFELAYEIHLAKEESISDMDLS